MNRSRTQLRASLLAGAAFAALVGVSGMAAAQTYYDGTGYNSFSQPTYSYSGLSWDEPAFPDPTTGRVYTPNNVGKDGTPVPPEDRAFDPREQQGYQPIYASVQSPAWTAVGAVPIVALPNAGYPTVSFAPTSLQPSAGRWSVNLLVANNAPYPISPRIQCSFNNGSTVVETVSVQLYNVPPGQQVAANVVGPASDRAFVDNSPCISTAY